MARPAGEAEAELPMVLSIVQTAAVLGISKDLAYDMVSRGELPALRFGRRLVVPRRALLRLLDGDGVPESLRGTS